MFGDNITEAGVPMWYNKATIRNQGGLYNVCYPYQ